MHNQVHTLRKAPASTIPARSTFPSRPWAVEPVQERATPDMSVQGKAPVQCGYSFGMVGVQATRPRLCLQSQRRLGSAGDRTGEAAVALEVEAALQRAQGGGQPLPETVRQQMEHHLQADLSRVRVHTSSAADSLARAVHADACTTGSHIFIRRGQYQPFSAQGLRLLAHEVTHTVQQAAGPVSGTPCPGGMRLSDPADRFERAAEGVAAHVGQQRDNGQPARDTGTGEGRPEQQREAAADRVVGGQVTGGPQVIQRKVGFEFETNMPIWANRRAVIAKRETLYESASHDWKFSSDAGHIEFVTEPFEEEGRKPEAERMGTAIKQMAAAFKILHLLARRNYDEHDTVLREAIFGKMGTLHQYQGHDLYIPNDLRVHPPTAAPQVTGGVHLDAVPALFKAAVETGLPLHSPKNPAEMALFGEVRSDRTSAEKTPVGGANVLRDTGILQDARQLALAYVRTWKLQNVPGREKLQGMLALVYAYLLAGARQEYPDDQAKYFLPLMSRMSFAGMYDTLPASIQVAFRPDAILNLAQLSTSDYVYKSGFIDKGGKDTMVHRGPRRKEWLQSIIQGNDLMSAESRTPVTQGMAASSSAMGEHRVLDPDQMGRPHQLVQIELRRLPKTVPPDEWEPLALTLFKMFQEVQISRYAVPKNLNWAEIEQQLSALADELADEPPSYLTQ